MTSRQLVALPLRNSSLLPTTRRAAHAPLCTLEFATAAAAPVEFVTARLLQTRRETQAPLYTLEFATAAAAPVEFVTARRRPLVIRSPLLFLSPC